MGTFSRGVGLLRFGDSEDLATVTGRVPLQVGIHIKVLPVAHPLQDTHLLGSTRAAPQDTHLHSKYAYMR